MNSTATGKSSASAAESKQKSVECDVCIGMTMFTSAMRDAREKPICIGLKSTKCEVDQQGFVELLEKRQKESKDNTAAGLAARPDQVERLHHIEAFLASLADKPQPSFDTANHDRIYAPDKEPFRYIYMGMTLYSKPPAAAARSDDQSTKMVLPLCVGFSYLQRSKQSSAPTVVHPLPPVGDSITPRGIFEKAQAACLFTAMSMVKYVDRQSTNFPQRYMDAMDHVIESMHVQWSNMGKLAWRIATLDPTGKRKDA
ncbi:Aste57867_17508 [Aphanomyces stellatus]|uniref:Aste57867_17508 protein n=1 Tax=Aphanomyces stellatus TaxID=120398 RepID=A0A485L7Y7_9STRA|nr:hypothetical protein As57867_017448 [Aphanomyces stellatus]VFT94261.1 Aste57867_17508 [Aphanomyces stellatus]